MTATSCSPRTGTPPAHPVFGLPRQAWSYATSAGEGGARIRGDRRASQGAATSAGSPISRTSWGPASSPARSESRRKRWIGSWPSSSKATSSERSGGGAARGRVADRASPGVPSSGGGVPSEDDPGRERGAGPRAVAGGPNSPSGTDDTRSGILLGFPWKAAAGLVSSRPRTRLRL